MASKTCKPKGKPVKKRAILAGALLGVFALLALPVQAANPSVALFTAQTTAATSKTIDCQGCDSKDLYAIQVTELTGTAVLTIDSSVNGSTWRSAMPTGFTTLAAGEVWRLRVGPVYRLNLSTCTGCSASASVTLPGSGALSVY